MHYLPYLRGLYGAIGIPIHRYRFEPESKCLQLVTHMEPYDLSPLARTAAEHYAREHDLAAGDYEELVSPFSLGAVTLSDGTRVVLGPLNYQRAPRPAAPVQQGPGSGAEQGAKHDPEHDTGPGAEHGTKHGAEPGAEQGTARLAAPAADHGAAQAAARSAQLTQAQVQAAESAAVAAGIWGMKLRVANLWLAMVGQIVLRSELPPTQEDELYQSVSDLVPLSLQRIAQEVKLNAPHNQYRYELAILDAVRQGDVDKVKRAFAIPLQGKFGVLGPTPLRSMQNHVHNLNSQVSRTAISAGVLPEKAYALSDKFFMAAEHCTTLEQCTQLRVMCAQAFAALVANYRHSIEGARPPLVNNALLLISRLIYDRCTVKDLATRLQVSVDHLERVFKQSMQVSLSSYIMGEKIKLSQEFLRDTTESINAIALTLGFADSAHFSHCFKRVTGLSPRQWRNTSLSYHQG